MRLNKLLSEILGDEHMITPSEFLNPPFKSGLLGGYRKAEVDAFMQRAADAMETLISELRELRSETDRQKKRLEEYRQMEMALRNALTSSQQFSENIIAAAKREAELIREEAIAFKNRTLVEANRFPQEIAAVIEELNRQKKRFRQEMISLLDAHRRLLDIIAAEESQENPSAVFDTSGNTEDIRGETEESSMNDSNTSIESECEPKTTDTVEEKREDSETTAGIKELTTLTDTSEIVTETEPNVTSTFVSDN